MNCKSLLYIMALWSVSPVHPKSLPGSGTNKVAVARSLFSDKNSHDHGDSMASNDISRRGSKQKGKRPSSSPKSTSTKKTASSKTNSSPSRSHTPSQGPKNTKSTASNERPSGPVEGSSSRNSYPSSGKPPSSHPKKPTSGTNANKTPNQKQRPQNPKGVPSKPNKKIYPTTPSRPVRGKSTTAGQKCVVRNGKKVCPKPTTAKSDDNRKVTSKNNKLVSTPSPNGRTTRRPVNEPHSSKSPNDQEHKKVTEEANSDNGEGAESGEQEEENGGLNGLLDQAKEKGGELVKEQGENMINDLLNGPGEENSDIEEEYPSDEIPEDEYLDDWKEDYETSDVKFEEYGNQGEEYPLLYYYIDEEAHSQTKGDIDNKHAVDQNNYEDYPANDNTEYEHVADHNSEKQNGETIDTKPGKKFLKDKCPCRKDKKKIGDKLENFFKEKERGLVSQNRNGANSKEDNADHHDASNNGVPQSSTGDTVVTTLDPIHNLDYNDYYDLLLDYSYNEVVNDIVYFDDDDSDHW
ncbi:uncharacterized protein LOC142336302 isoform X2 [Convolutriloba macropyga]|uniref:uncharacterized protein LOC142336302 isoform X2 n=1 Tax=Convolutriloba macropyga TaxID=536237 RepID=UPI003F51CB44